MGAGAGPQIGTIRASGQALKRFAIGRYLRVVEMVFDYVTVLVSLLLGYGLYDWLHLGHRAVYAAQSLDWWGSAFGVVFIIVLDREGGYNSAGSLMRIRETERVLRSVFVTMCFAIALSFFIHYNISRWVIGLTAMIAGVLLVVQKQLSNAFIQQLHERGFGLKRIAIFGAGDTGRRVFSALNRSPKLGMLPVVCFDEDAALDGSLMFEAGYRRERSVPVRCEKPTVAVLRELQVDTLIVAVPTLSTDTLESLRDAIEDDGITLASVPQNALPSGNSEVYADLDGVLISSMEPASYHPVYGALKRVFDILCASLLLTLFAPLFAVIAIAIRLESRGSAFFQQKRIGCAGVPFSILKFRSMYADAPAYANSPMDAADTRITKIGRFLRRTSLDELPQLINVVRGEMTLVGPRPEMPFIVEKYTSREKVRLQVVPGITGLWQLSADRAFEIHENLDYDVYYIRFRNFFMDLAILVHTALFAMRGV